MISRISLIALACLLVSSVAAQEKLDLLAARTGQGREKARQRFGGFNADKGIALGLEWFAKTQADNGKWRLKGPFSDGGQYENTCAATGFALLVFLGDGNTHAAGKYKQNVAAGVKYLIEKQTDKGALFADGPARQELYTHGICTLALCELYGMTGDETFKKHAQRAIDYCVFAQAAAGGWRYAPRSDSDTSVSGWVIAALDTGRDVGLDVPQKTFDQAGKFLDAMASNNGSQYRYQAPGFLSSGPSHVMTASGLLSRLHLGWRPDDRRIKTGTDLLVKDHLPRFNAGDRNVFYWYHADQLLFHTDQRKWQRWQSVLHGMLLDKQSKQGDNKGSWDPVRPATDMWGYEAGRLYVTALSVLCLEDYYRYPAAHLKGK